MKIVHNLKKLDQEISIQRLKGKKIGFVPTMGAIHDGHLSLINVAKTKSDFIVVSIFVNPTQFARDEDFDSYPRTEKSDALLLEKVGADLIFAPTTSELYSDGLNSDVKPGSEAQGLETDFRPDFFKGVVNVVDRLFKAVKPDVAVFGEKDYQQLQVIKQMVTGTNSQVEIIGAPIIRDGHGLALSSRNAYLSNKELKIAQSLNIVLQKTAKTGNFLEAEKELLSYGFREIEYIEMRWNRILAAVWLGNIRLIDNVAVK